jgi:ATP-dependent RNA helicase RhlE
MTFQELGLSEPILRAVAAQGYTVPTPIQVQAIPHVIAGRDLLGCAQTGTGKTAAFALPILQRMARPAGPANRRRPTRVLVLGPTRELVAQIADSFQAYGRNSGLRQAVVFGGVSQRPQTRALDQGVDVLIATPGRLVDLMNQGFVDLRSIEVFVLDEADRMLDMGFLPDLRRVTAKLPSERQTLFFSATMPTDIAKLAEAILRDPVRIRIPAVQANTPHIDQSVFFVPKKQKTRLLADVLTSGPVTRALVFTRTKHGADRVVRQLSRSGIQAAAIHGNKSQQARQRTLAAFKHNAASVLVATDIASRGIDVEGISHVVNYDMPHEPETYVHRIGRTGRAGAAGTAISFCDDEERQQLKAIERLIGRSLAVAGKLAASPAPACAAVPASRPAAHDKRRSRPHAHKN